MTAKARRKRPSKGRSLARICAAVFLFAFAAWLVAGVWFVHHPRKWLEERRAAWPAFATDALLWIGNPAGDVTDGIGLTGEDAVVTLPRKAPSGEVLFAGVPVRVREPAPDDIKVLDRGEFLVGWSPRLRHPVWCAYHVPPEVQFESAPRPAFRKDGEAESSPVTTDFARTGFDRGHMVPNYAIVSRFGPEAQAKTFLLSNVTAQSPALNRGIWREFEHRISDLWTARWGEIWVIVGCVHGAGETLSGSDIDVPSMFWQLVVAQNGGEVRALAVVIEQDVPWKAWPARYITSIDELEEMTGLDLLSALPDGEEAALEAKTPSRLWPVRFTDIARQLKNHVPARD